jgi:protein-S-isoprenylcysteine O-methyltransferase Ste14
VRIADLIIVICWALFWAYWLIAAWSSKAGRSPSRHPIYTGVILAMLGTALATTPFGLIAVAVLAAYFIYSATREESYLAEQFPDTYPAYKRSTKMLVPFVF